MKTRHVLIIVILLFSLINCIASPKSHWGRANIAFEIGVWKPTEIDPYPSKPLTNVKGADPVFGVNFISPIFWGVALQLSTLQWHQHGTESDFESILIRQLMIDIKHPIVSQVRISPYVCYGINLFWSKVNQQLVAEEPAQYNYNGIGANVGTGVDFALLPHIAIAAEYQYIYADLNEKIGLTSNYSGPKLSVKLILSF